jgi:leucyl/phenylalanyl-tRNA--protein transferase
MAGCVSRGKHINLLNQDTDLNNYPPTDTESSILTTAGNDEQQRPDTTWIVPEMVAAYAALHAAGDAHSVEVWKDGELVGGLYGVSLGGMFWGESMFSRARDASKVALLALAAECRQRGIGLIDAQFHTPHLESLGGFEMLRADFVAEVAQRTDSVGVRASWHQVPAPIDGVSLQDGRV